jgi:hypothetical protein
MKISKRLERHIYDLENELLKPDVRRSADRIGELLADGFFEFGSSGRIYDYTAGDVFDDNGAAYKMEDFKANMLSHKCVLATYKAIKIDPGGNVTSVTLRSSIWKRRGGAWKMVFHQGTPMKV